MTDGECSADGGKLVGEPTGSMKSIISRPSGQPVSLVAQTAGFFKRMEEKKDADDFTGK